MRTSVLARHNVADLLLVVGPDAPTLCEGWTARDLAAHLVVRDRRPDTMPGIMIERFAGHTKKVQDQQAAAPFPELVDLVRSGPPKWSPMRLGPVDQAVNLMEYAIHAEDIRRANDHRDLPEMPAEVDDDLWKALPMAGTMALRKLKVGVVARCAGRDDVTLRKAGAGQDVVTMVGAPRGIVMAIAGRGFDGVELQGPPEAVRALRETSLGM